LNTVVVSLSRFTTAHPGTHVFIVSISGRRQEVRSGWHDGIASAIRTVRSIANHFLDSAVLKIGSVLDIRKIDTEGTV
jgi:hypothetical protein